MKMAICIVELERVYGIRNGSAGKSDQHNVGGENQKDLASELSITDEQLRRVKKLTSLSPNLQELIESDELKATTAYNVWSKLPLDEQNKFIEGICKEKKAELTQKQTAELFRQA